MSAPVVSISPTDGATSLSLALVRSEYERADTFYSEVQSFRAKAGIPALNELRNAGKHILCSIGDDGGMIDGVELQSALTHCRRAAYEAYESGILFALEIIHKFKTDYSGIVVSTVVPGYAEILQKATYAMRAVEDGRKKGFDRDADHSTRMESFRDLRILCERLDICRDEANLLLQGQRASGRQYSLGIGLTVLSLVLALLFGIPSFVDWLHKADATAIAPPSTADSSPAQQ